MPSTYSGYELVTREPDWTGASWTRETTSSKQRLDNTVSAFQDDPWGPTSVGQRGVRWVLTSRSEVTDFRAFLARCSGQLVPFWLPSWNADLSLVQSQVAADNTITIHWSGYYRYFFTDDHGRRHLAFIFPDRSIVARRVTDALDNGDGTETLTLDATFGVDIPIGTMVSFLTLCRFADDEVTLDWQSRELVTVDTKIRELPREAPTS